MSPLHRHPALMFFVPSLVSETARACHSSRTSSARQSGKRGSPNVRKNPRLGWQQAGDRRHRHLFLKAYFKSAVTTASLTDTPARTAHSHSRRMARCSHSDGDGGACDFAFPARWSELDNNGRCRRRYLFRSERVHHHNGNCPDQALRFSLHIRRICLVALLP